MRGRGQYVADIRLAGMQDVAFLRSPIAHGRIRGLAIPPQYKEAVFTSADLNGVKPIRAVSSLPGFKASEQPVLATGKVRQVGELVAMCVAATRAEAEDIAASLTLDIEELPAVHDMLAARAPDSPLVHEHWGDNIFLETFADVDITKAFDAPIKVTRELRTSRQAMCPMEGRAVVAAWDIAARAADGLHRRADAAHQPQRLIGMFVARSGGGARGLARCRRRFRLQRHSAARGNLPFVAGHAARPSRALDRGSARASDRQRQLPRASLCDHRLRRSRRALTRHRLRSACRFRRVFLVSLLGVPRSGAGRQHPAGALRF